MKMSTPIFYEQSTFSRTRASGNRSTVVLKTVSEGLADTQADKLASLAEAVEFESEEKFAEKLKTLRESYFSTKPEVTSTELTEDVKVENQDVAPGMEAYVNALSRWSAKSN